MKIHQEDIYANSLNLNCIKIGEYSASEQGRISEGILQLLHQGFQLPDERALRTRCVRFAGGLPDNQGGR
ncbi:Uncharacterised protein [Serratia ficaria]|nr:Uncharacterised protein [Serratia ficaria]CAI1895303.1 Uncharacterised protein [Serratia ficaria]CAI2500313.1 Uncharacterised protein [Serratia ficaria]CAI2523417.1 Uncharacterised protein [Serratia ficaria]CAI2793292.1 Uncharacterised protein [Serratia ficaria]